MTGALILTIGIPGSGKTTQVRKWFEPTQITSLDGIRSWLTDDEGSQDVTPLAVELQQLLVAERCRRGLVTCVDNTNLVMEHRAALIAHAVLHRLPTYAIVFDVELDEALSRNAARAQAGGRFLPAEVIERMHARKLREVPAEGPVPGFTVTRRISAGSRTLIGMVPREHLYKPWAL